MDRSKIILFIVIGAIIMYILAPSLPRLAASFTLLEPTTYTKHPIVYSDDPEPAYCVPMPYVVPIVPVQHLHYYHSHMIAPRMHCFMPHGRW